MKDFLGGGRGSTQTGAQRRERFYQAIIWLLVIWNLCLQARSLSKAATDVSVHVSVPSALPAASSAPPSSATGSFTDPTHTPDAYGHAAVVCSGCTTTAGNASGGGGASNASAGNGAGNGADGFNLFNATDFNSPLQAATLSANSAKLIALKGKGKVVSVPPAPPIPAGLPEGATCSSGFKGDAKLAQCLSFCIGKYARTHCQRCKCRACSFPARREGRGRRPHLGAEAARRRRRQQRPRRRPQRRPRRATVGSGGRSGRDGGREHAGRHDCYCRRHCDCCELLSMPPRRKQRRCRCMSPPLPRIALQQNGNGGAAVAKPAAEPEPVFYGNGGSSSSIVNATTTATSVVADGTSAAAAAAIPTG